MSSNIKDLRCSILPTSSGRALAGSKDRAEPSLKDWQGLGAELAVPGRCHQFTITPPHPRVPNTAGVGSEEIHGSAWCRQSSKGTFL